MTMERGRRVAVLRMATLEENSRWTVLHGKAARTVSERPYGWNSKITTRSRA